MSENKQATDLTITDDLKPILSILKEEDAKAIIALQEELTDTWTKKQVFRTETEMRISVLNDGKHPTQASKYWQSIREQNGMFESVLTTAFDLRRNTVKRLKLERKMEKAIQDGDEIKQMEIQIDLDENLYQKVGMEQSTHDRIREIKLWSQIKEELNDGSFNDKDVNAHQAETFQFALQNRVNSLGPNSNQGEVLNAVGPLQTIERLKTEDGKLLNFKEAKEALLLQAQEQQKQLEQSKE